MFACIREAEVGDSPSDDEFYPNIAEEVVIGDFGQKFSEQAVDDKVIKSVEYVAKDDSIDEREKFQKIHDNHEEFVENIGSSSPSRFWLLKILQGQKTCARN